MKIIHTPAGVLHQTALPVEKVDKKVKELLIEMAKTLNRQKDPEGVGLAAPQVGVSKQIFLIKPRADSTPQAFINPKILGTAYNVPRNTKRKSDPKRKTLDMERDIKKKERVQLEGCLSIPKIWGEVKRPDKVKIKWLDESGREHTEWFEGFPAVVIQHEMDHLHGILFTKHVIEQKNPLYREENGELVEFEI